MSVAFATCTYRYRRGPVVLDGLSFGFPSGRTVLLGPNGAGKTTLLAIAASALQPRAGTVAFAGLDPAIRGQLRAYRRQVGWMPQHIAPVPGMTCREQVAYAGWLKGMTRREAWGAAVEALGRVGLAKKADQRASALSGGQLRRVGVAQTLVHDSRLVLLDEPTAGLDPAQRGVFRKVVEQLSESADVIVSTHQTEDLSEVYDHVVVLSEGTIRFSGTVKEFHARAPADTASGRWAEGAYAAVLGGGEAW
ncbi:ATP-binding cassette domain-containing protein [Streptomyces tagetis]|uniref:ATP-binding cassette domain-containing protein n=1 Tax=Streptomyces tagetis TaxID=2820809 RepID=A0A940XNH2_9ACTN|nr:ATP-binding cassette domain-containing protein [Streptomyces sp. RG38]MBQ0827819.1 ATP-binding cassette domain-containing protein [Streptomyces sp. RG38]